MSSIDHFNPPGRLHRLFSAGGGGMIERTVADGGQYLHFRPSKTRESFRSLLMPDSPAAHLTRAAVNEDVKERNALARHSRTRPRRHNSLGRLRDHHSPAPRHPPLPPRAHVLPNDLEALALHHLLHPQKKSPRIFLELLRPAFAPWTLRRLGHRPHRRLCAPALRRRLSRRFADWCHRPSRL